MNREPTVLDFIKSLFRGKLLAIPALQETPEISQPPIEAPQEQPEVVAEQPAPAQEPQNIPLALNSHGAHCWRLGLPWWPSLPCCPAPTAAGSWV